MPIFHGVVERIGGGRVQGDNETVDALEVKGYPEWRTLHGKSYIMDHLRSSVGKQVVVAISGRILVAVKRDGRVYSETGFKTVINSGGVGMGILTAALTVIPITFPVGLFMYFRLRRNLRQLVSDVERT